MKNNFINIVILFVLTANASVYSQQKITILHAENTFSDKDRYAGAVIAVGGVSVAHEGAVLDCEQALIYRKENLIKAFGNVIINQGDTLTQHSKYVHYDGNNRKALSWGDVILKDPSMELRTDTLHFDRLSQTAYYNHHAIIRDSSGTLESEIGRYYLKEKRFEALSRVVITQTESVITSDKLDYHTDTGESFLYGKTEIDNGNNKLFCRRGYYNNRTGISYFTRDAKILYRLREIYGDSLYYDRNKKFASATGHVKIKDTANRYSMTGGYAEYFENKDSVMITNSPVIAYLRGKDSLYMYADTLIVTGRPGKRKVKGFHRVKFYKNDIQGACDSIYTDRESNLTEMFGKPVIWNDNNQLSGDTIYFYQNREKKTLDSLFISGKAFAVNKDSLSGYNQIKGNKLSGKFKNGKLSSGIFSGNAESLNYQRDENGELIGITHMTAASIRILLRDGEMQRATYIGSPEGKTYPPSKFPPSLKQIKGFAWREEERPLNKNEIYPPAE